jgi:putative MFS transporter
VKHGLRSVLTTTVVIGALGYFVDIYDLVLFSIVRVPSLKYLGVASDQLETVGIRLLNMQMGGMLLGGILWGILGDKKGRVSVLFGSILMYSLANIANGVIGWMHIEDPVGTYAWLRFIAGVRVSASLVRSQLASLVNFFPGNWLMSSVGSLGCCCSSPGCGCLIPGCLKV